MDGTECPECQGEGVVAGAGSAWPYLRTLPCPLCSPLTKDRRAEYDPRGPVFGETPEGCLWCSHCDEWVAVGAWMTHQKLRHN